MQIIFVEPLLRMEESGALTLHVELECMASARHHHGEDEDEPHGSPAGGGCATGGTVREARLSASAERCGRALTVCCGPLRKVGIRRALPLGCDDVATKSLRRQEKNKPRDCVGCSER